MQLETKHFGTLEIDDRKIITFPEGIPGFQEVKKFIIVENSDESSPFCWLQCVDRSELAFVVANPFLIKNDYDIELDDKKIAVIDAKSPEEIVLLCIVVVPEDLSKMSMNLKAPIVINRINNLGMQVILDTDKYSVRHYILEELRRQEVAKDAGTDKKEGTVHSNK